ncbi:MAG: tetratricopeptide repeat protein [Planctomycetota bacterium]
MTTTHRTFPGMATPVALLLAVSLVANAAGCGSAPVANGNGNANDNSRNAADNVADNADANADPNANTTNRTNRTDRPSNNGVVAVENADIIRQVELARVSLEEGKYDLVIRALQKALESRTDLPLAYYYRGEAYRRLGKLTEAEADLRAALELQSDLVPARIAHGRLDLDAGRASQAVRHFTKALQSSPGSAEALQMRGRAHEALKNYAAADADYSAVLRNVTTDVTLWYDRGRERMAAGDVEGATADLDEAVRFESPPVGALIARARLAAKANDRFAARDLLGRALQVHPDDPAVLLLRADLSVGDDDQAAVDDYTAAMQLLPAGDESIAIAQRGRLLANVRLGNAQRVIDDATILLATDPTDAGLLLIRANATAKTGVLNGAVADLLLVLDTHPDRLVSAMEQHEVQLDAPANGWTDDPVGVWTSLATSAAAVGTDAAKVDAWYALLALLLHPTVSETTKVPLPLSGPLVARPNAEAIRQLLAWLDTQHRDTDATAEQRTRAGDWRTLLIASTGVGRDELLASVGKAFDAPVDVDSIDGVLDGIHVLTLVGGDESVKMIIGVADRYAASGDQAAVQQIIDDVHHALHHLVDPTLKPAWRGRFANIAAIQALVEEWAKRIAEGDK